jgi:hypothetical protein
MHMCAATVYGECLECLPVPPSHPSPSLSGLPTHLQELLLQTLGHVLVVISWHRMESSQFHSLSLDYTPSPPLRPLQACLHTFRSSCARSTAMTDAAQPMPERLNVLTLSFSLNWLTTVADKEGVGLKALQLTIKPSICKQSTCQEWPSYNSMTQILA